MNQKTLQLLREEQEMKEQVIDLRKHIKDLEAELEFLYVREPHEVEYIERLKNLLDNLYEKVDTLKHEIN